MKWLASSLIAIARRLMPPGRKSWTDAMRAELDYLSPMSAIGWAVGCVIAAVKQRWAPMNTGTLRISRWVMFLEAMACFGPLTLAWFEFTFGPSGIVKLNADLIAKLFPGPSGTFTLILWYAVTVTGFLGAWGLLLGLRYALTGRALQSRLLGYTLIGILAVPTILGIVLTFILGPVGPEPNFGITMMFVILPIAGLAHLMHLARPESQSPMAVAA